MMRIVYYARLRTGLGRAICGLPLLALLLTAGCGKDEYKGVNKDPLQRQTVTAETVPPVQKGAEHEQSLEDALGVGGKIGGAEGDITAPRKSDHDYTTKSDIYWKLNWIKKQIDAGRVPSEIPNALRDIAMEVQSTDSDDKKPLIADILRDVQTGVDANDKSKAFRQRGIDPSTITWGMGRVSLESKLTSGSHLSSGISTPPAYGTNDTRRQILDFEETYHASPAQVQQQAFARASHNIERLGDMLGLLGREPNTPPGTFPQTKVDVSLPY